MSPQTSGAAEQAVVVDARGLRCPLPVIRLAQAARDRPAGSVLELWATDPAARADVPAWCRMRGHELLATAEADASEGGIDGGTVGVHEGGHEGGHTAYRVRLGAP